MKTKFLSVLLLLLMIFLFSCSDSDDDNGNPITGEPTMEVETRDGILTLSENATVSMNDLEVTTFVETVDLGDDGSFSVQANEADNFQVVIFKSKSNGKPVYLGLYEPNAKSTNAGLTSTALALTLFNPFLVYSNQQQRSEYLLNLQGNSKFTELVNELNAAYQEDAENALDYNSHPVIYQLVVQLMKETMENLGNADNRVLWGDPPTIEDAAGPDITFVNPRFVWYAAEVFENNDSKDVISLSRQETVVTFNWGWPPAVLTEPAETNYDLGDGQFEIFITKGGDFSKISQWDDPEGRATALNTAQTILYIMELFIGNLPLPPLEDLGDYLSIPSNVAAELLLDVAAGNAQGFLMDFSELINENADDLAEWLWQVNQGQAAEDFVNIAANIFSKMNFVFSLLGHVNEQGPFVYDVMFAPQEITYFINQQDGVIVSTDENEPPVADFTVNPPAGIIGTEFTFDASVTTDDITPVNELLYRWDWTSDGSWDTSWSSDYTETHSYSESGAYNITLEVKDTGGLTNSIAHTVNVGGGAGTATHVKLFRDVEPWDSNAMIVMLEALGFTEGVGENTYEIIPSTEFGTVSLTPGEDLIIISNDQTQTFYDNYSYHQTRFTNFVYMGGTLFWEACDEGWNYGSIATAGIVLPGNLTLEYNYDYNNYVTDQNLPLVAGLPNAMDHNYASHESFTNLPSGTTVYCVDSYQRATLIEFSIGGGWVIVTGQPLEHQYEHIYGSPDMEELLPRIVAYFTGKTFTKNLINKNTLPSTKKTH